MQLERSAAVTDSAYVVGFDLIVIKQAKIYFTEDFETRGW